MKETPVLMKGPLVRRSLKGEKTETRRLITQLRGIGSVREFAPCQKAQPDHELASSYDWVVRDDKGLWHSLTTEGLLERCPYGQEKDRLWVRETWAPGEDCDFPELVWYKADDSLRHVKEWGPGKNIAGPPNTEPRPSVWRPSIFLPRYACRLILSLRAVRVERLHDITDEAIKAEGVADLTFGELLEMGATPARIARGIQTIGYKTLSEKRMIEIIRNEPRTTPGVPLRDAFRLGWDLINGHRPGARWADNPWVWALQYRRVS